MSIVATELDYKAVPVSHGTYQLSKIIQQTGGTTVTLTPAGAQESVFELAPRVMNLGKSILSFTATPAASGANQHNWFHIDGITCIRQIQLYTRTGTLLCDIQDLNKYMKMTMRRSHKVEQVSTFDKVTDGAGYFEGLRINNTLNDANVSTTVRPDYDGAATSILEPSYCISGDAADPSPVINFQIPLSRIVDSVIGLDRDQYFTETIYLKINWAPSIAMVFVATSATNPTNAANGGTVAFAGNVVLSGLTLYACIEQNPVIIQEVMNKASSGTLTYLVPYVHSLKQSVGTTTSQNLSVRYSRNHGEKLKKILWSPFNIVENINTTYDNTNIGAIKVTSYYTMLNNVRFTQFNYDTATGEDWMDKKHLFKGSCILSSNEYYYNWTHVEDFTNGNDNVNVDGGYDLNTGEVKYDIIATTANAQYMHYIYAIVQRKLTITPNGISIS